MSQLSSADHKKLLRTYISGFVLSILLTLIAYVMVDRQSYSTPIVVAAISILAIIQLVVQLVFFLHLGDEPKPRWNLQTLLFAVLTVIIIGFGSLWIMNNLNYNMQHDGKDYDEFIQHDEGITR